MVYYIFTYLPNHPILNYINKYDIEAAEIRTVDKQFSKLNLYNDDEDYDGESYYNDYYDDQYEF